jgi:methylmalonyl-CoA/ethylmalonyl-CoA epimerase
MTDSSTGLGEIAQIALAVADEARATEFYRDTLGLRHLFTVPGMAFFDCGGVRLLLGRPEEGQAGSRGAVLYHRVGNIKGTFDLLRARGVEFQGEPHVAHRTPEYELWLAFFNDPDGNTIALMSETPAEGGADGG